ncbi:MAG: flagellin, partial [Dorea sp.]|nr:flagellin [Dorea sp.]
SLVQTAEGALTEVHSMLNRMVELATQSANGTYSSTNRTEMQKEVKALKAEIDRISKTANFNGTTLFTGTTTSVVIHAGETSSSNNQITITLKTMNTTTMGDNTVGVSTVNIGTQTQATASIDTINKAIDAVSSMRSDFGALQNRLEHTINNLGVQTENLSAAESRIRDVDMAKEMMAYTKNNILVQASQAMLAQANQVPQGVLQLLQ